MSMTRTCALCERELAPTAPGTARFCRACGWHWKRALRACEESVTEYPLYQVAMRARYGPGPWRPGKIRPEHRWRVWSEQQRMEEAQAS